MGDLCELTWHPHHAAAVVAMEKFRQCVQGQPISVRACDDGSIELRALGPGWRATVYLDDLPDDSGWILVRHTHDEAPNLDAGPLDDWGRLACLLVAFDDVTR